MSVDVLIDGKRLDTVASHSASEFATSLDPSDMSGGIGQITVTLEHSDASKFARHKKVVIEDSTQGTVTGTVVATSSANGFADTITADSRLLPLTYTRTALPYHGTLGGLLRYYFGLVDITAGILIEGDIDSVPVTAPGWTGVVLDSVKRICSAHQVELSLVSNNVVVRGVRQRVARNHRDSAVAASVDDTNLAQAVELFYLKTTQYAPSGLIYPRGGWSEDDTIISVEANEVEEVEIDLAIASGETGLGASIESLVQPTCVDFVGRGVVNQSAYCVVGNDGKPIPAARWEGTGGKLEVEIGEDTRSIVVRVTGSTETGLAPFRIAASSGTSDHYSSLRVMGAGVLFDRQMLRGETGNSVDLATEEVVQVESDFIVGVDAAWRALFAMMSTYTGPSLTLSVTTKGINRLSDSGSANYPLISDFNVMYAGKTLGDFNAEWAGKSFADFNAEMYELMAGDFTNQAFGNVAGARVKHDGAWYRIREATVSQFTTSYTAVRDMIIGDWNEHYAGMTLGDLNALAAGKTLGELAVEPLLT